MIYETLLWLCFCFALMAAVSLTYAAYQWAIDLYLSKFEGEKND